jgi:hypothetical protein
MTDEGKFSDSDKRIILFELQKTFKSKITVCNKIARTMITNRSRRNSSGRSTSNDHNHDDDNNNYVGDYNDDGDIDDNNNDNNQMTMMLIQNNILYYFYYDNFSITNQIILNYKANRDDDHDDFNINKYIRIIYSIILLILLFMMIGYLFYFVLFLIRTSLYQQQIYIYSFCISMIIDSFLIQLIIIMFYDIILPLIIMKEVHRIKEILLDCMIIQKNRNDNKNICHNHDDNNNLKSQRSSRITAPTAVNQSGFNTASYYYISRLLAKEFESFHESKLISIYHTTNPMISSRITKKAIDKEYYKHYNHYSSYYCMIGFYIITTVISIILSSVMLLFLQSPKILQEFIIQSSASVIISMAIIVTLNFYHIYKFYSFIPLIVLTIIMILWVRFTAYYDYMRRFKLYQHLALSLNVQNLFREQSNLHGNKVLSSGGSGRIIMNQERSRAHHTKKVNNVQSDKVVSSRNRRSNSIRQIASSINNLLSVRLKNPTIVAPMLSSLSTRYKDHSDQDEFSDSVHSSNSFGGSSRSALSSIATSTGKSHQQGRRFSLDKSVRAVFGGIMNVAKGNTKNVNNKGKINNDDDDNDDDDDVEANIYQLSDSDEEDDKDIYQLSDSDEEKINQSSDANDGDEYHIDDEVDVNIHESDILSSDDNDFDHDNNRDNYDIYKDNEDSDSISNEGDSIDDNSYYYNNDYTDVVNDHDDNNNYSYDDAGVDNSSNSNIHRNRLIVTKVVDDYPNPVHIVKVKRSSFSDSMHLSKIQEELSKDDDSSC